MNVTNSNWSENVNITEFRYKRLSVTTILRRAYTLFRQGIRYV